MITDAIAVLQGHQKMELDHLNEALDAYQKLLNEDGPKTTGLTVTPTTPRASRGVAWVGSFPRAAAASSAKVDPELTAALEEKRRQIRAIEEERQRELDYLKNQLTQAQLTLTPQHPMVQAIQQQIETLSRPPPELVQLKSEERTLAAQIAQQQAAAASASATPPPGVPRPGPAPAPTGSTESAGNVPTLPTLPADWDSDGRAKLAHSKLEAAIKGYQDVTGRIQAANVELDLARTSFKYRYAVVTPAEIPKAPKKPLGLMVGVGSVLGGLVLAILAAAVADLMRGRILESWQVRRSLKVDILGELD
jgi:hypothetical protein